MLKSLWKGLHIQNGDLDSLLDEAVHHDLPDTSAATGNDSDFCRPYPAVLITAKTPSIGCKGI